MVKPGESEAPQVADHEQCVLVDRVLVKQVVLHATDNTAECWNVEAEHTIEIHAPEFVRNALRRPQDGEEQPVIARVQAKLVVDQVEVALDEADREGADAADIRMLLQQQKQLEQRGRVTAENLVVDGLQVAVLDLETLI